MTLFEETTLLIYYNKEYLRMMIEDNADTFYRKRRKPTYAGEYRYGGIEILTYEGEIEGADTY